MYGPLLHYYNKKIECDLDITTLFFVKKDVYIIILEETKNW